MKKRLSLLDLHSAGMKKNMLDKVKGGADIRCICSFNNPLVTTRESGGAQALCFCNELNPAASVKSATIS